MDSRTVELIGRHRLIEELLQAGLEVATPLRDRGVDLIAYMDQDIESGRFRAIPVQMKAATGAVFSVDTKYAKFPEMIIVYVWWVTDLQKTISYAMTHHDSVKIAHTMGYTNTNSYRRGYYMTNKPSRKLLDLLKPFRSSPERWRRIGAKIHSSAA